MTETRKRLTTVETNLTLGTLQDVVSRVVGYIPGVSIGGRLDTEVVLLLDDEQRSALRAALSGRRFYMTVVA